VVYCHLEVVEGQIFININWYDSVFIVFEICCKVALAGVKDLILIKQECSIKHCNRHSHLCKLHVDQGGLKVMILLSQLEGLSQQLSVGSNICNVLDKCTCKTAALVCSKSCKVHNCKIISC